MEKYYIVTDETSLHKDYFTYKENAKLVNGHVNKFFAKQGIEAREYYVSDNSIYIVPSEKDFETFDKVLNKPVDNGLCKFKAGSRITKSWIELLKEKDVKVIDRPRLIFYLRSTGGSFRSRLFDIDGTLYCSIDPARDMPNGFEEMKASEFFKVIEDAQGEC